MWQWHTPADWAVMGLWMIVWIVLVIVVVGLTIWLIARLVGPHDGAPPRRSTDDAEEILRRRFAAGEIDAEEYERRLQILRRDR